MATTSRRALVFAGGDPLVADAVADLPADALVVAADSGLERAQSLGRAVDVVVGDFDSCSPTALARAEAEGTRVDRHPAAKDATDLELALDVARGDGARHITVVGGHGGRLDHLFANALLLAAPAFADVAIDARIGTALLTVVRTTVTLTGRAGELLTLLPVGGPARGVRTEGLRYPLHREDLPSGTTRGVSNVFVEPEAVVAIDAGVVVAIQPEHWSGP